MLKLQQTEDCGVRTNSIRGCGHAAVTRIGGVMLARTAGRERRKLASGIC